MLAEVERSLEVFARSHIISDKIDSGNLLEHLIDICEGNSVEFTILAHFEQAPERAFIHFNDGGLNGFKLILDKWVVARKLVKTLEDFQCFVIPALHHKPTGGLGKIHNRSENYYGEDNLESQRESPCDFFFTNPRKPYFNCQYSL